MSGGTYSSLSTKTYIEIVESGWGLPVHDSDIMLDPTGTTCGGMSGLSEVTINNTFNTPVPQIVLLGAGGTALSATACYPNNPF